MQNWPHAPAHRSLIKGTYMVTAATYLKVHHFSTDERLQFLHNTLLAFAQQYHWELQAWAVFANHYHFIAQSPDDPKNLSTFLSHLHVSTAKYLNSKDNLPGRRIWWQYCGIHILLINILTWLD